jgi:hypothetical protein
MFGNLFDLLVLAFFVTQKRFVFVDLLEQHRLVHFQPFGFAPQMLVILQQCVSFLS